MSSILSKGYLKPAVYVNNELFKRMTWIFLAYMFNVQHGYTWPGSTDDHLNKMNL